MQSTIPKPKGSRAPNEDLRGQFQSRLADFVEAEIQLGKTFAELAVTERTLGNMQHFRRAKEDAAKAVTAIRKFLNRIEDAEIRTAAADRCDELERSLRDL